MRFFCRERTRALTAKCRCNSPVLTLMSDWLRLRSVASEVGCSPSQAIIAWMRQSDPPILPIIAGSRTEQFRENIAALDITLNSDQMRRLDTAGNPAANRHGYNRHEPS